MKNFKMELKPLKKQSFFQKLLKKHPQCNFVVEIHNLLVNKSIKKVNLSDINNICLKYKANIKSHKYMKDLCDIYKTYLKKCLNDNILTDNDIDELNHLRELLSLDEQETLKLHNSLCGDIYKYAYSELLSSENNDEAFIAGLQNDLRLPDAIVHPIMNECRDIFIKKYFNNITEDDKISPDEWEKFNDIAKKFHIKLEFDSEYGQYIEKLRINWRIENEELPVKDIDITLKKGEKCYYSQQIEWFELRKVTQRVDYSGLNYRIKIAKGLSYRIGSIKPQRITSDEYKLIDSGTLYVTNKRLIFDGGLKNTNIPFSKILSIVPYSDAVGIEKDSGKSPVFKVYGDANLLTRYLVRVLKDSVN
jgi:hypothetical protein